MLLKSRTLVAKLALLISLCAVAVSVSAQEKHILPRSSEIRVAYLSTQLLLNPCGNEQMLKDFRNDSEVLKSMAEARAALPPGVCEDPALAEKIFTLRFLQYATLRMVSTPWNMDAALAEQNRRIGRCRDAACLSRELDRATQDLMPEYSKDRAEQRRGPGLCHTEARSISTQKAWARLSAGAHQTIVAECHPAAVLAWACGGPGGQLLSLSCEISGNQANAPQWLYRTGHRPRLLVTDENGPFHELGSFCNGMPDLMTAARMNMGEHWHTYYRFDGRQYRSTYAYTSMGVGSDDDSVYAAIAQDAKPNDTVICK